MDELVVAKKRLFGKLGDQFKIYLNLLKSWFRCSLTKEEFDCEARKNLTCEVIQYHNEFLVALLNKCKLIEPLTVPKVTPMIADVKEEVKPSIKQKVAKGKRKAKSPRMSYDSRFQPANPGEFTSHPMKSTLLDTDQKFKLSLCAREECLPDHFHGHLHVYVLAWEAGLDGVSDESIKLINIALRDFIKNILTAALKLRSSYRLRDDGKFCYSLGVPTVNPYLINSQRLIKIHDTYTTTVNENGEHVPSIRPTIDWANHDAMEEIASCDQNTSGENVGPISLWNLLYGLIVHKNAIPSHTVYAPNFERILTKL